MSKKIEKLKEVNELIKNALMELETKMFIENISNVRDKVINDENLKSKFIAEINQ